MSQDHSHSGSDSEYEPATDGVDGGDEDWWDAEEQGAGNDDTNPGSGADSFNETALRAKILAIHRNDALSKEEKAKRTQGLMTFQITPSSAESAKVQCESEPSSERDSTLSYHDKGENILGCKHYQRKCKLQAFCCSKMYVCRFCHDDATDHPIVRQHTKNMQCMVCSTVQPANKTCAECGVEVATYYCDKCKLWDDDPKKNIYHCDDCGICRKGRGLGVDFFHCKTCNICMAMAMKDKHRCIERNLESDCPICGEFMFTSTTTVIFMPCGHCMHRPCYNEYIHTSYQCPICLKSLGDMSQYFANLDRELERQSMPAKYEKHMSNIFCNDCEKKSLTKYHFIYHKCRHCDSYNTTVLGTEAPDSRIQANSSNAAPDSTDPGAIAASGDAFSSTNSDQEQVMPINSTLSYVDTRLAADHPPSSSSSTSRPRPNGSHENEG